jgi:hypothetical protein
VIEKVISDANGNPYRAYVGYTKTGIEVPIDADLADIYGNPEEMLAMEIKAYKDFLQ